ncbi:prohead protease/major capsid protein fusion protein [Pararhodospirillum oryzae]|uniref:Peptidase U35 n=1 Tax=Pararhodospirillum oryzae TaxID=478448 RepID=A0A512H961_9PROT|nr:prohead protease/major capsid protein fusion protein [Pararhodospirillum oryzae]GEO81948.1 hypothetical protein ROR02_20790 [Pararhodospirillum oryzae]
MPDLLTRVQPLATFDADTRTGRAVITTGAPVARRDLSGPVLEILPLDAMRPAPAGGVPLLDSHRRQTIADILGRVTEIRREGDEVVATFRLADRPDLVGRVADGTITDVSIGYSVGAWRAGKAEDGTRTITAQDFTIVEVSLVPLGADPGAKLREAPMTDLNTAVPSAPADDVRALVTLAGLPDAFAADLIARNVPLEDCRAAVRLELGKPPSAPIQTEIRVAVGVDHDAPHARAARMGEALYARLNPAHALTAPARDYAGMTTADLARDCLTRSGMPVTGLGPAALVTRALHVTSDFPLALADTVGRTLRDAYRATPSGVRQLGRQTTARDFRARARLQMSDGPELLKVSEAGEFTRGTLVEAGESYRLDTYGRIIGLSRQAIINDDLGVFADLTRRVGAGATTFECQFLVDLITANAGAGPILADGKPLFHADHGNRAAMGGVLSEATLSAGRLALRRQTDLTGRPIDATPAFLLVPAALETMAEKLLSQIQATRTSDVNPFTALTLAVDPRLDDVSATRWYLAASPATIDGLEYAYLEGAPGPQIETRAGFDVDGVEIKVRLDFGAGFVDHRGWYCNEGA